MWHRPAIFARYCLIVQSNTCASRMRGDGDVVRELERNIWLEWHRRVAILFRTRSGECRKMEDEEEEMKGDVERGWRETPIYASVRANIGSYRRYNDILSVLMRTHRYRYVHRRFARYVCAPVGREAIAQLLLPFPA